MFGIILIIIIFRVTVGRKGIIPQKMSFVRFPNIKFTRKKHIKVVFAGVPEIKSVYFCSDVFGHNILVYMYFLSPCEFTLCDSKNNIFNQMSYR